MRLVSNRQASDCRTNVLPQSPGSRQSLLWIPTLHTFRKRVLPGNVCRRFPTGKRIPASSVPSAVWSCNPTTASCGAPNAATTCPARTTTSLTSAQYNSFPFNVFRRIQPGHLLLVLAFVWVQFFLGLGGIGLVGPDEPRYAQVAREMLVSGDFVTPRYFGEPWLEKPGPLLLAGLGGLLAFRIQRVRRPAAFGAGRCPGSFLRLFCG